MTDFHRNLSMLDWLVVGLFLSFVASLAVWVKFSQKGRRDFFLASRSMGWFVVMFSTFATLFSTVSFISVPGEGYKNGLMTFLTQPVLLLAYPVAIALFLRFYLSLGSFTIFEYLENRYNPVLRYYSSMVFCLGRVIYGGAVLYAASKLFHGMTGWDERLVVLCVGTFTLAYCITGGMKAVLMTDVLQGFILLISIAVVSYVILDAGDL
jgi:Na+/proline symporter